MTSQLRPAHGAGKPLLLQIAFLALLLVVWEAMSLSGYFYRDVIPSAFKVAEGLGALLLHPDFYRNLAVTMFEAFAAFLIGCTAGIVGGMVLGANTFLSDAYERYFYYFGTTPKIILFPVIIMWFGIGPESKVAMGALACFLPTILSTAAGMRAINPTLVRVGRSFNASPHDMALKIYLPAIKQPALNGVRLGVALSIVSILLAETKLSNMGLGFMIMDYYSRFDMPSMYAVLIIVFVLSALIDAAFRRVVGGTGSIITSE
jgi:NitT/TauT family transport system permease protein